MGQKGAVVVFLVRVILFMMSRRAQDTGAKVPSPAPNGPQKTHRARPRPKRREARREVPPCQSRTEPGIEGQQGGPITREEMTRLFGNALRVR